MRPHSVNPGAGWIEIITRPTLAAFSGAFAVDPVLEALVAPSPVTGAAAIREFFGVTGTLLDSITFTREISRGRVTYLEWEGVFAGAPISGTTTLEHDAAGRIERIRLAHYPLTQRIAFAIALLGLRCFAHGAERAGAPRHPHPNPMFGDLPCV